MADKNSVADWDTNANNNDNISSVNIAEGCAPSGINNAIRAMMAQIKTKFNAVDAAILSACPPGTRGGFAMSTPPDGWLKRNGAAISRTAYAALFAAIGTTYGAGNGTTTFNVPDDRGEFDRAWDDGRGVDAGRAFGSLRASELGSHTHTGSADSAGAHGHTGSANAAGWHGHSGIANAAGAHSHTVSGVWTGSTTRPNGANSSVPSGISTVGTSTDGNHSHSLSIDGNGEHTHTPAINAAGAHTHTLSIVAAGGAENRLRNRAFLACIKY
ncbi:tail fiber protein [Devosia sp. A8/3-2]|nr:tail fiber protein [Devosia sp. A8/3-2]